VRFSGDAEFKSLLLRLAVREELPLTVVAPSDVLTQNLPVWRTRLANDRPTHLLSIGPIPGEFAVPVDGTLEIDAAITAIGILPTIIVTATAAIVGEHGGPAIRGLWTSDPLLVGAARGAALALRR
jgi:hypothetical protein